MAGDPTKAWVVVPDEARATLVPKVVSELAGAIGRVSANCHAYESAWNFLEFECPKESDT